MGALISYTVESGLVLLAFYLMYKWLLSGRNEPGFSRAVILSGYFLAAVLPAVWRYVPELSGSAGGDVGLGHAEVTLAVAHAGASSGGWMLQGLCAVYAAGVVSVLVLTLLSWRRVSRLMAGGEWHDMGEYVLVVVDASRVAPMSRMNRVMMNRDDSRSDIAGYILSHELAHIRHRHVADLLPSRHVSTIEARLQIIF